MGRQAESILEGTAEPFIVLFCNFTSCTYSKMPIEKQLRVSIIGAGLAGGALANALLNDPQERFKVQLFERDDLAFSSERGGYQIRLGEDGITGLKQCLDAETYEQMRVV